MKPVISRLFCILAALAVCPAVAEGGEGYAAFKQFMEHEYLPLMKAQRLAANTDGCGNVLKAGMNFCPRAIQAFLIRRSPRLSPGWGIFLSVFLWNGA